MGKKKDPPDKKRAGLTIDRISGAFLLALSIYVAIHTYISLPLGTHYNPGPGYMPMLLAITLGILSIIILVLGRHSVAFKSLRWPGFFHAACIVGCCVFSIFAIERLGYRVSVLIILLFLFGYLERLKVWVFLLLTFGLTFGSYWIFHNLLNVPLPLGGFGF
jgi:hypothetical protein